MPKSAAQQPGSEPKDNTGAPRKRTARWSDAAREAQRQRQIERKKNSLVQSIPEAGARLGLGKNAIYELAKREGWPIVLLGKRRKGVAKEFIDRKIQKSLEGY